jgi:hypothetical protein
MADCHVDAIRVEIREAPRGRDVEFDVRVPRAEAAEARYQPRGGEGGWCADGEQAGLRCCLKTACRLADLAECVADRRCSCGWCIAWALRRP